MKPVYFMLILSCLIVSGCASSAPVVMDNGTQRKIITRCDNDIFCFKKPAYDVTWDSWSQPDRAYCKAGCGAWNRHDTAGYPVSYRSNEYVHANDPNGYIVTLPAGGNVTMPQEKSKGAVNE